MARTYDSEKTRKAIIEAAAALFFEKGFDNTSMEDIVERSGASKGAIYYYFKDKNDLSICLFHLSADEGYAYLSDLFKAKAHSADEIMDMFFEFTLQSPHRVQMYDSLWSHKLPSYVSMTLRQTVEVIAPLIADIIRQGVAEGLYTCATPDETAAVFSLLFDIWLDISIFDCTYSEMEKKLGYLTSLLAREGAPMITEKNQQMFLNLIKPYCKGE